MLLIAGLGNPGARHAKNRHNIGFMALEAIAARASHRPIPRAFSGRARRRLDRGGARRAARAADVHERFRPQRRRGDALSQARPRRHRSSCTTNSTSRRPKCASRSAAAMPAIMACARSAPISAMITSAFASASAIPATRRWSIHFVLSDFAKSGDGLGRRGLRRGRRASPSCSRKDRTPVFRTRCIWRSKRRASATRSRRIRRATSLIGRSKRGACLATNLH